MGKISPLLKFATFRFTKDRERERERERGRENLRFQDLCLREKEWVGVCLGRKGSICVGLY